MDVIFPEIHYAGMEHSVFQQRVLERIEALGTNAARVSREIGRSDSFVRDILRKESMPKADNVALLAKALGTSTEYLLGIENMPISASSTVSGPVPIPTGRPKYAGRVQAGDWLAVDDIHQDLSDHLVPEGIPLHPRYPQLEQLAWQVQGDSMDQAGITAGMWIVGASYAEYVDRIAELGNGDYVVVERSRYQGQERELTVKEVQFARLGIRLVPRSSNPRHKEFFIPLDHEADSDREQISIVGVVFWFGRDVDPRSR